MKLFSLVENVILKLGGLPGLGFLTSYVTDFHGRTTRLKQTRDLYKGYVTSVRDAGGEIAQATRGGKAQEAEEDEEDIEEEEEDDFESYMQ
jgi:hypothetical protein